MKPKVAAIALFVGLLALASWPGTSRAQEPIAPNPAGSVAGQLPPDDSQTTVECQGCHVPGEQPPYLAGDRFHKAAHAAYDTGIHADAIRNGRNGATCLDCHSANGQWDTVFRSTDPRSTVNHVNVSKTCAKCHEQPAATFQHSIHGAGLERGIGVAATCSDCHGAHDVFALEDPRSRMMGQHTLDSCAKCHQPILDDFRSSSHFAALQAGDARAPVCTTCHTAVSHADAPETLRGFQIDTIAECAKCHEKQAPSYRDTFHGQAITLGFQPAATCADCHTAHRNLPAADPQSSVNQANLIGTCGRCHSDANAGFVTYDPHVEPTNPDRSFFIFAVYTFMSVLLAVVFGFFGLHTLLWLQRSIVGLARGETPRHRDGAQWVVRFNRSNRWTHIAVVVSFLVLAATGLPLMFSYTGWGQGLTRALGGLDVTRFLHRVFAVVTFGYAFYHFGYLVWMRFVKREPGMLSGPDSMVPRWKDVQDLRGMLRWFFYIDKKPPKLDRWTYWEKFDYFAVFWGVPIIGLSGLVLWLPSFFTQVLPGSFLNVAMIVHGEEALLATGFIFAFHFFHNHMRPENFPLDTVIFTGKMPIERFESERPEEYRRLVDEDRLDEVLTTPPTPQARRLATVFGFTSYLIGLALVVAIFWTLLTH